MLGDEESKNATKQGLKSAASFMRGQLARKLNLRNTPELTFLIDHSIEYGVRMSKLIDEVNKGHADTEDDLESEEDTDDFDSTET